MIDIIHIVDDDCTVRAAISFLLTSHGYATQIYSNGAELLRERRLHTGCILLDLRMDEKSGLDVLEELQRRGSRNPVIAMSGDDNIGAIVQSMKLGALDFVKKPYDPRELLVTIERVNGLAQRRGRERRARAEAEAQLKVLSPRQLQVLRGLIAGMTNKEIARRLELSHRTVEMHRLNMIRDLGVRTTSSAMSVALLAGLEPLEFDDGMAIPAAEPLAPIAIPREARRPVSPSTLLDEVLPPALDIIEGTTDGVMLLDHDFNITYLNRNAHALLGEGRKLVGYNVWTAFPGAARTRASDELEVVAKHRKAVRFGFLEPELGRWFDVSARPIPSGLQVCFRDQSRERSAFTELRCSEESLRLALEATGDAAWDWDLRTGLIRISPSFVCELGYADWEDQALEVDVVRRLIHPFDRERVSAWLEDHLAGRAQKFACEYRIRRSGGGWMWCLDRGRIVARNPETGEPTRMVGTVSDVGWLKEICVRADEARERIKLAEEGSGAGAWDLDLRHRLLRMSPRAREMHGTADTVPQMMPESVWEASVDPDDIARVKAALEQAIANGSTYSEKYRAILPGGERRWIFALGRPVADEAGVPSRFVGIVLDETERELAARELRAVQDELAHTYRMMATGTVASNLAHELNQPLTALRNYASGLRATLKRDGPDLRKAVTETVDGVETSAMLLSRIVDQASEPARWARIDRRPESLTRIAADAAELFKDDRLDVKLAIEADGDRVSVDRLHVQQLLVNLIRNAADAMRGTIGRRVLVSATPTSRSEIAVRISDEGPGIASEVRERLFAPFVTTKPNGIGIGLAICRTIVEAHGGRIWAESSPLGGATIAFILPRATGD